MGSGKWRVECAPFDPLRGTTGYMPFEGHQVTEPSSLDLKQVLEGAWDSNEKKEAVKGHLLYEAAFAMVLQVPYIHFEPSLDALTLRSDCFHV